VATSRGEDIEKAKEDLEIAVSGRVKQMIQEKMQQLLHDKNYLLSLLFCIILQLFMEFSIPCHEFYLNVIYRGINLLL
jgi:hypothetical protein